MKVVVIFVALLLIFDLGCGGGAPSSAASVSGPYEFVVTSQVTGGVTLVEANLTARGNQANASGVNQIQVLTYEKKNWYLNGVCAGQTPGSNSMTTSLIGSNVTIAFNEGGNTLPGQGTITGTAIDGNYSVTDSPCPDLVGIIGYPPGTDFGGIAGNQTPALAGTYSGTLNLPDGTDDAAFTLTENPDRSLSVSAELTGPVDNGTFTFTGSAVGNIMFVSGSVNGNNLSLLGYYDRAGAYTGWPNSLLVFNYGALAEAGLLLGQ